jgi:hypothetical protein
VAVSFDDGETFPIVRDLECAGCSVVTTGSEGSHVESSFAEGEDHGPEFSYPSLLEGVDGRIHVTYTWSEPGADMGAPPGRQQGLRAAIKYVVLSREFLGLSPASQPSPRLSRHRGEDVHEANATSSRRSGRRREQQ